ncbi:MAG: CHASE2 domain-containing protein, partial [Limnohabitans sp.]
MSSLQVLLKWLSRQSLPRVRWSLIGGLGFWSAVHILWLPEGPAFDRNSYDQMVKRRLLTPSPDSKMVIVDIDERSLDELKQEFGRWPWPRETLASVLEWVNRQGAQAVVFDILFADADMLNPASDAAFVQTVQASDNTYFPVLRLNPENDHLSEILAHQLPGFTSQAKTEALSSSPRLAVVPPVFEALIQSRRLGYHNISADDDGVNRFYQLWEEKDGWRLWSLPARLAMDLKWPLPEQPKVLIQYTQHKDAFKSVSFSEIWKLSQTSAGQKPYPMFKDAVVVIGATATSLFDVKVTPLATTHPGVMILANVIDNLKNQRFLRL